MEIAIITIVSAAGVAATTRAGLVGGINFYNYYSRKKLKMKLKKELKLSIQNFDYLSFQEVIYKIKNYDTNHNKSLYIKMKHKYRFTDRCTYDIYYFNKRFNIEELIISPTMIKDMIHTEIERSISKKYD
jgi:hypothetical protein